MDDMILFPNVDQYAPLIDGVSCEQTLKSAFTNSSQQKGAYHIEAGNKFSL